MNEKFAVGLAILSTLAVTMFLSKERLNSQDIIEEKKATYQRQVSEMSKAHLKGQK